MKKYFKVLFWLVISGCIIWLILLNKNNCDFLKMNLYEIISIFLLLSVSYYLVEKKTDERILKEKIESTINLICGDLQKLDMGFFRCQEDTIKYTMLSRRVRNKIGILEYYQSKFCIEKEVEYIKDMTFQLDDMISNHLSDVSEIRLIMVDIANKRDCIEKRLDDIFKKLY